LMCGVLVSNYNSLAINTQVVEFFTPKGEKSKVILYDGTVVWLNSGSHLSFTYDSRKSRRVARLEGEAYFDVAKSKTDLFVVDLGGAHIEVYGTKFNVLAYADNETVETTLEEGSIGFIVKGIDGRMLMKPGEQAVYNRSNSQVSVNTEDVVFVSCWKEQELKIDNEPFVDVVKKLERWYQVEIDYDRVDFAKLRYTMTIKNESIEDILDLIQYTTPIRYKIEQNRLLIKMSN